MIIYCHAVRGKVRFSTLFSRGTRLTEAEIGLLLRFEHHNCFSFDAETDFCPVGLGAGRFLSLSDHVHKRFFAVVRLVGEQSSITDEAAQLFKILNIKQQTRALRLICLNYLGQVGGQQLTKISFLEDLALADSTSLAVHQPSFSLHGVRADCMR